MRVSEKRSEVLKKNIVSLRKAALFSAILVVLLASVSFICRTYSQHHLPEYNEVSVTVEDIHFEQDHRGIHTGGSNSHPVVSVLYQGNRVDISDLQGKDVPAFSEAYNNGEEITVYESNGRLYNDVQSVMISTEDAKVAALCGLFAFWVLLFLVMVLLGIAVSHIQLKKALAKEKEEEEKALSAPPRKAPIKRPKRIPG